MTTAKVARRPRRDSAAIAAEIVKLLARDWVSKKELQTEVEVTDRLVLKTLRYFDALGLLEMGTDCSKQPRQGGPYPKVYRLKIIRTGGAWVSSADGRIRDQVLISANSKPKYRQKG